MSNNEENHNLDILDKEIEAINNRKRNDFTEEWHKKLKGKGKYSEENINALLSEIFDLCIKKLH